MNFTCPPDQRETPRELPELQQLVSVWLSCVITCGQYSGVVIYLQNTRIQSNTYCFARLNRRQTLAFKGFVVSGCGFLIYIQNLTLTEIPVTMVGLVFGAESALIEYENLKRREENNIRRQARLDLARRGLIGTETEIAQWKAEREREKQSSSSLS